jgi:hypothetical protein
MSNSHPSKKSVVQDSVSPFKMPPEVDVPAPPAGFVATSGAEYRGVCPKTTELVVVGDAIHEVATCADLAGTFGRSMPSAGNLVGALTAAAAWSTIRAKSLAYDEYCRTQEGLAWVAARKLLTKAQPIVLHAAATDPTVAAEFPSLVQFLSVPHVAAQRAAATRRANQEAAAKGETPTRGRRAKALLRAAERSALAAQTAKSPTSNASPPRAAPSAPSQPVPTTGATNGAAQS